MLVSKVNSGFEPKKPAFKGAVEQKIFMDVLNSLNYKTVANSEFRATAEQPVGVFFQKALTELKEKFKPLAENIYGYKEWGKSYNYLMQEAKAHEKKVYDELYVIAENKFYKDLAKATIFDKIAIRFAETLTGKEVTPDVNVPYKDQWNQKFLELLKTIDKSKPYPDMYKENFSFVNKDGELISIHFNSSALFHESKLEYSETIRGKTGFDSKHIELEDKGLINEDFKLILKNGKNTVPYKYFDDLTKTENFAPAFAEFLRKSA